MRFRSVLLVCGMAAAVLAAESGNDLFQKGLAKERAEGDVRGAIQFYQRVASMAGVERKLAAEALFRVAECQQSLGTAEARKTYQRIVKDFGDQREVAARAGNRLSALEPMATRQATELAARRVWVPPSTNLHGGSLSADGRFFSYAEYFTGGDLTVRDLVTGETRHITRNASFQDSPEYASSSVISPDRKKIAYTWKAKNRYELRIIDWDGSNQKTVYTHPEVSWLEPAGWSPDGREILLHLETRSRTRQIAWIPVAGGTPRVLKTFPWQVLGDVKSLSPDGRYIAYDAATGDGKNRAIFILASDGSSENAVTDGSSTDEVFGWMPDGRSLLFATERTGARELWALPVYAGKRNGEPSVVKPDLGQISTLGISRDGSLLYSRRVTGGQVYTASIDWSNGKMSAPVAVARGVVPDNGADWSPDGKQVAFVAHRGTEQNDRFVVVHSFESGRDRVIRPKQQLHIVGGVSWSPDGKSYLVGGRDASQRGGLYTIDLTTGDVHTVVQREGNLQSPRWLPGGKEILYVLREPVRDKARVFIRNIETGADREISLGFPNLTRVSLAVSPDGQELAFAPGDNNRYHTLYVIPMSGGSPRQIYELGADAASMTIEGWSPDSQRVVVARAKQNGPKVEWAPWWIPAGGGAPHAIETSFERFRLHPDGKRVVSVNGNVAIEFWMLQNLSAALATPR